VSSACIHIPVMATPLLIWLIFLNYSQLPLSVLASTWSPPLGNETSLRTEFAPGWVHEPPVRGTWSILYGCVFTLVLCVYSVIHLNVPRPGTRWNHYTRKGAWMLIALVAPEVVLFTAWLQWTSARRFCRDLNTKLPAGFPKYNLTFGYVTLSLSLQSWPRLRVIDSC